MVSHSDRTYNEMFEKKVLSKIYGPRRGEVKRSFRKSHNE
jgi:hypothetical protein